jgi:hypothetical protein
MSTYHEEPAVIKYDDATQEMEGRKETNEGLSRRRFLRKAAVGAAGAVIALEGAGSILAQSGSEDGDVTLDGIMINYASSPDASTGSATLTLTDTFASTFRLQAQANSSITLTTSFSFTSGGFMVGSSETFSQSASSQVTDAITISSSQSFSTTTPAPGMPRNTVLVGILSPRLNFNGDPTRLLFRFLDASDRFTVRAGGLQDGLFNGVFRPTTIDSMLAAYPPLVDRSGVTLSKPRFKRRFSLLTDSGVGNVFTFSTSDGSTHTEQKTVSLSVEITGSVGFTDPGVKATFQVGEKITITLTAVQEITSTQIMSLSASLQRTSPGIFTVFRDRVFKTFLFIDAGPPALSGQPVVYGTVTDTFGNPIAGAIVTVSQTYVDYTGVTDTSGNYIIATPSGEPMDFGSWPITCGNSTRSVYIDSSSNTAGASAIIQFKAGGIVYTTGGTGAPGSTQTDFAGVDPNSAQNGDFPPDPDSGL